MTRSSSSSLGSNGYGPSQDPSYPRPSGEALGPRYVVRYSYGFPVAARGRVTGLFGIDQVIYPYARHPLRHGDHMAWLLTPGDQRGVDKFGGSFEAYAGWSHSAALTDLLVVYGLPAAPPTRDTARPRGTADHLGAGSSATWVALVALGMLFLLGAAGRMTARPRGRTS